MNKIQRFKEGIKNLTPLQQLNAKATGSLWGAIGLSIAFIGMLYSIIFISFDWVRLGFSIFVFFLIYMQIVQYIGVKQQIAVVRKVEQENLDTQILKNYKGD